MNPDKKTVCRWRPRIGKSLKIPVTTQQTQIFLDVVEAFDCIDVEFFFNIYLNTIDSHLQIAGG